LQLGLPPRAAHARHLGRSPITHWKRGCEVFVFCRRYEWYFKSRCWSSRFNTLFRGFDGLGNTAAVAIYPPSFVM
jgi:hypothetical protein